MDEWKPCPFCGANDPYYEISEDEIHVWVACGNCFATSSRVHTEHHTSGGFAWNTRPIEDALRKKLEIAVEALTNHIPDDYGYDRKWVIEALAEIEKIEPR